MSPVPKRDTAAVIVDEVIAGLAALTPAELVAAVGIKQVAARAGISVATVYHHFGSLEGLADAVLRRVFSSQDFPVEPIVEHVERLAASAFPAEVARAMHLAELDRLANDAEFRVRMGLWSLGGAEADERYAEFLRGVDSVLATAAKALFDVWGREMSPPFDLAAYVAAHVAFLNGASIRTLVDPDALSPEQFAVLASSFGLIGTRAEGNRRTAQDRLTELNWLPVRQAKHSERSEARTQTRHAIVDAAAEIFASHGLAGLQIAEFARLSGIGRSTVYAHFDSVDDLATHLLRHHLEQALAAGESPVRALKVPLADAGVREVMTEVGRVVLRHAELATAYGARLVAGSLPVPDPAVDALAHAVSSSQEAGHLRTTVPADQVAEHLLLLMVSRLLARPAAGVDEAVHAVAALVLDGLRATVAH